MNDCTKDFIGVCVAKRNAESYIDCTDGSYEMMVYNYRDELANFKHLIEGKSWILTYKNIEIKGNSFTTILNDEIEHYRFGTSDNYKFEVE